MVNNKGDAARRQLKNVALFGVEDELSKESNQLPIGKIKLPKQQPRRYFDPDKQNSLIDSVRQYGILEPLLVRPMGNSYELVAGERRYQAAQALNLKEVPVVVREMDDRESRQIALVENLQRENLNPVEETEAILELLGMELNLQQGEVTALLHQLKKQDGNNVIPKVEEVFASLGNMGWLSFVQNRLPLLNLSEEVLLALRRGEIEYTKARAINMLPESNQRQELLKTAMDGGWSLQQIRSYVKDTKAVNATDKRSPKIETPESQLSSIIGRVRSKKSWEDPAKWKKIQALMKKLDEIIS
jgi:ParB family transcriptional regulator, chromosome partitioning protein